MTAELFSVCSPSSVVLRSVALLALIRLPHDHLPGRTPLGGPYVPCGLLGGRGRPAVGAILDVPSPFLDPPPFFFSRAEGKRRTCLPFLMGYAPSILCLDDFGPSFNVPTPPHSPPSRVPVWFPFFKSAEAFFGSGFLSSPIRRGLSFPFPCCPLLPASAPVSRRF